MDLWTYSTGTPITDWKELVVFSNSRLQSSPPYLEYGVYKVSDLSLSERVCKCVV